MIPVQQSLGKVFLLVATLSLSKHEVHRSPSPVKRQIQKTTDKRLKPLARDLFF
jgi:hypothetical protein